MTDQAPDRQHEEVEHIPWSILAGELDRGQNLTKALYGVLILLVALGVFAGVRAARRSPATVVAVPAATEDRLVPSLSGAPPAATRPTPTTVPPTTLSAALYSEADLMAVAPVEEQRWAAVRAERAVIDHFSVEEEGDAGSSWVDWARTAEVRPAGPGRYDVTVVFSTLVKTVDTGFARSGVRAVSVPIEVAADGSIVLDLPHPVPAPEWAPPPGTPPGDEDIPPDVAEAALAAAQALGEEVTIQGGAYEEGLWRVVVTVRTPPGPAVPIAVELPG